MDKLFSIIILKSPKPDRLKAKGSFELVGFSSMTKKPTRVSILSTIETAILIDFLGILLSSPKGR